MNKFNFKSIKTRLVFWFLLLSILPLMTALVVTYFQRVHAIEASAYSKLTAIRDLKVQQVNNWIEERKSDLKVIAGDYEIRSLENIFEKQTISSDDVEKIEIARKSFNRILRNYNDYSEVFFVDTKTGLVEISTNQEYEGTDKSNNPFFNVPIKTGEIHIKDIYRSETTGDYEMTFSAPVYCMTHNKHIMGVLVIRINLEKSLYKLLSNRIGLGKTGETLIVNRDAVALNELRWYENAPLNLKISAEPAVNAAHGETGITKTTDYRGEKILAAYTYIPTTGWGFVCKQDMYELNSSTREMLRRFIYIFIFSVIAITLIALLISNSISNPIIKINQIAQKIGAGDYSARNTITTKDELGELAKEFNNMAEITESKLKIQQGVYDISEIMIEQSSMQKFGKSLLKQLMKITGANMSVFYILNETSSEFEHYASIGANWELIKPFNNLNPEGEVGNALSEKTIYYLREIPDDTKFKFKTSVGDLIPKEIITIPIFVEGVAIALISLVNIHKFSKDCYDIIKQSWMAINTTYSNLLSGERTRILAEQLFKINQQLEAQTEELQEQSEELQNQAEELQQPMMSFRNKILNSKHKENK